MIANARLSERSLRGYAPARALLRSALKCVRYVAAQSRSDAARYRLLGADASGISVAGNLKFDMPVADNVAGDAARLREAWGRTRPVWIAASTHEGEELPILEAHLHVLKRLPDALLLLAPRHPERFRSVEQAVRGLGFRTATHSEDQVPMPSTQCFVIDAVGELMSFYAASDVAFVGGSLVPIGGHNVLEPAALSRPVLVGRHTFNFEDITDAMIAEGAAERAKRADQLGPMVLALLRDEAQRARMGAIGHMVFARERGAVGRVMAMVAEMLENPPVTAARR
jgi:3-deoxy-D-manno-octulosonic-acid transferase